MSFTFSNNLMGAKTCLGPPFPSETLATGQMKKIWSEGNDNINKSVLYNIHANTWSKLIYSTEILPAVLLYLKQEAVQSC